MFTVPLLAGVNTILVIIIIIIIIPISPLGLHGLLLDELYLYLSVYI
jgi:hypothetical protein